MFSSRKCTVKGSKLGRLQVKLDVLTPMTVLGARGRVSGGRREAGSILSSDPGVEGIGISLYFVLAIGRGYDTVQPRFPNRCKHSRHHHLLLLQENIPSPRPSPRPAICNTQAALRADPERLVVESNLLVLRERERIEERNLEQPTKYFVLRTVRTIVRGEMRVGRARPTVAYPPPPSYSYLLVINHPLDPTVLHCALFIGASSTLLICFSLSYLRLRTSTSS